MGMQCQFTRNDLPDGAIIGQSRDKVEDTWIVCYRGLSIQFNSPNGDDFWFDCGSATEQQMGLIKQLISWGVCLVIS